MHNLTYLGNGQYRCADCGEATHKAGVGEFQKTDCEAKADLVAINIKLARLEKELAETVAIYYGDHERLSSVEERIEALDGVSVLPEGT